MLLHNSEGIVVDLCISCRVWETHDNLAPVVDTYGESFYCCQYCYQSTKVCPRCRAIYIPRYVNDYYIDICRHCEKPSAPIMAEAERLHKIEQKERNKVFTQLYFAKQRGLDATLTTVLWVYTLQDFNSKCAYCLTAPYEQMDHFLPLSKGGGTSPFNCVPACKRCNQAKGRKHPKECTTIAISFDDIVRVHRYLYGKWQISLENREKFMILARH